MAKARRFLSLKPKKPVVKSDYWKVDDGFVYGNHYADGEKMRLSANAASYPLLHGWISDEDPKDS